MKKRPHIIVLGMGMATQEIIRTVLSNQDMPILIVANSTGDTLPQEKVQNAFDNSPVFEISRLKSFEPLDNIDLNEVRNPWPSPKGRRGKKRY